MEFSGFNPSEPNKLCNINRLTGYLVTELLLVGYSKSFLYNRPKNKYLIYKREGLDNYSSQDRTRANIA